MLSLERLQHATLHDEPFGWSHVSGVLAAGVAGRLRAGFPSAGFTLSSRLDPGAEKRYRMATRTLVAGGVSYALDDLSQEWRMLVAQLQSAEYRRALSALTGVAADGCATEIRLCRYESACWMAPHTDRADKRLTQIVYFNDPWPLKWGGCLRVLRSPAVDDAAFEAAPLLDTSVVLIRSERSWHAVAPVAHGVREQRLSLLIHLSEPG